MTSRSRHDSNEYDFDEDELDAESETLDDEDAPTISCPYCDRLIHEDAQRCPHCHEYISDEDCPPARKKRWLVLGLFLCLVIVWLWITGLN